MNNFLGLCSILRRAVLNDSERSLYTNLSLYLLYVSFNFSLFGLLVSKDDRYKLLKQRGATLWLTGLSGSGKSTVSVALEQMLFSNGYLCYRLDGDNIRHGLNNNLGFSPEDRKENIRRISEVAKLMGDIGVISTTAFISPYKADREFAKEIHKTAGIPFVEIYVNCPLEVAEERDPKGLYKKARKGIIKQFTGINAPYEAPENPDVEIDTSKMSLDQCAEKIVEFLVGEKIIPKIVVKNPESKGKENGAVEIETKEGKEKEAAAPPAAAAAAAN